MTRTYEKTDVRLKGEKGDTFITFEDMTNEQKASFTELVSNLFIQSTDADIERLINDKNWIENMVYYTVEE